MWYRIIEWFTDLSERRKLIREFNELSRNAFILGVTPTLLKASITLGDSTFKHSFSKMMSGFRIKALSGRDLETSELHEIANVILENTALVRKLMTLGWDTLEVHDNLAVKGLKWSLERFAKIGGLLE